MKKSIIKLAYCSFLVFFTIFCSKKSEPKPLISETKCQLTKYTTSFSGSAMSIFFTYTFDNQGKAVSGDYVINSSWNNSTITSTFLYDNSGLLVKSSTGNLDYQTFEYNNGNISKSYVYNNGTLTGYGIYYTNGSVYYTDGYNSQNIKSSSAIYTISGLNCLGSTTISYSPTGQITNIRSISNSNFDDKLSVAYTSGLNIPGYAYYNGASKNNPLNTNVIDTYYNNGSASSTSTTSSTFRYTYNSSNVVSHSVETTAQNNGATSIIESDYTFSNCN